MSKKNFLFPKKAEDPHHLFEFLKQKIVQEKKIRFPDTLIKTYVHQGFVKINGHSCRDFNFLLKDNDFVSIVIKIQDIKKVQKPPKVEFDLSYEDILFEDKQIIVVQKPAGVPTHSTLDPDRDNLFAGLKRYLTVRDGVVPYLGLHHRLDRDTSGLILLTKKQSVNRAVGELFSQRKIKKSYVALTIFKNLKKTKWTIQDHLARSTKDKKKMQSVQSGGDLAITHFEVLKHTPNTMMILCEPQTGRTHQIRVHLYEYGLPILGDPTYFKNNSNQFERLFLHAWKLQFPHPVTNEVIQVESKIPDAFERFFKD